MKAGQRGAISQVALNELIVPHLDRMFAGYMSPSPEFDEDRSRGAGALIMENERKRRESKRTPDKS